MYIDTFLYYYLICIWEKYVCICIYALTLPYMHPLSIYYRLPAVSERPPQGHAPWTDRAHGMWDIVTHVYIERAHAPSLYKSVTYRTNKLHNT